MFAASDVLMTLHLALLLGLLGVTSLLLLVTVTNRLRLRRITMSWRNGRLFGIPAPPAVFISLLLLGVVVALVLHRPMSMVLLAGYLSAGMFWFVAAYITKSILITEHGIILNVNCTDRSIAWGQVVDYFEYATGSSQGFVFFYRDDSGVRRRLQVDVPADCQKRFQSMVAAKLDARFDFATKQAYGKTPTEG